MDSLAGTSRGKTISAYRLEYKRRIGPPTHDDALRLADFVRARKAYTEFALQQYPAAGADHPLSALLARFLAAPSVPDALGAVRADLAPEDFARLQGALEYFEPQYQRIWDEGDIPVEFVQRARVDPQRAEIASLLHRIAGFFDVDPKPGPHSRVVLVPVPSGFGTHAETVGRYLLMEVRRDDTLADEASVIAHESSHFLFEKMNADRLLHLAAVAGRRGANGRTAWATLHEALPTALGQGVVDHRFRPASWSLDAPWYHLPEVDAYAKAIYPLVSAAIEHGQRFDDALLEQLLDRFPGTRSQTP